MFKALLCLIIVCFFWLNFDLRSATARQIKPEISPGIIVCFSGGREILREEMISGPFADEYKFAHKVKVKTDRGEQNLNFAGGLCIIDRPVAQAPKNLTKSDLLSCYSGADEIVNFEVYGRESTVDEYVEGRTFLAKAKGKGFDTDSIHEYLVFSNGACIGSEV
ncbi:hypothetical protein [Waterburya agarophytonicola]|uniref:hypothetical protein n=1 Tax=Waterburya agarophytonicola TaxID=2886916 RepID=UPI001E2D3BCA|nr:hypothetical protein [Waterburya agarophytonicola]